MSGWFWLIGTRKRKQCYYTEVKTNKGNKKRNSDNIYSISIPVHFRESANLQVQKNNYQVLHSHQENTGGNGTQVGQETRKLYSLRIVHFQYHSEEQTNLFKLQQRLCNY